MLKSPGSRAEATSEAAKAQREGKVGAAGNGRAAKGLAGENDANNLDRADAERGAIVPRPAMFQRRGPGPPRGGGGGNQILGFSIGVAVALCACYCICCFIPFIIILILCLATDTCRKKHY